MSDDYQLTNTLTGMEPAQPGTDGIALPAGGERPRFGMDTSKVAGLMVVAAVAYLALIRRAFSSVLSS